MTDTNAKKILCQYFSEVLGVDYGVVMKPENSAPFYNSDLIDFANQALQQTFKVLFISHAGNSEYSAFQPKHYELFAKMRAAMKLQPFEAPLFEIQLGDEDIIPKFSSQFIVFFEEHVSLRDWSQHEGIKSLRVASPGYLTVHPEEKKEAWLRLQMILEQLR